MSELCDPGAPCGLRSGQRAAVTGPGRGGEGRAAAARVGGRADEEDRMSCGVFSVLLIRLRTNT